MADTNTPNYAFTLPEVGGSGNAWGPKLNANFSAIDGLLSLLNNSTSAYMKSLNSAVNGSNELRNYISAPVYVTSTAALKALDTSKDKLAFLIEAGKDCNFIWKTGDYSTLVAGDATGSMYIPSNGTPATGGAWIRASDYYFSEFANLSQALSAAIPSSIKSFTTLGYAAAADGGGAKYVALAAIPAPIRPWHVQTYGGRWWVLDQDVNVSYRAFGGIGVWGFDDRAFIQAAIDYAMVVKQGRICAEYDGYPQVNGTLYIGNGSATQFSTLNGGGLVKKGGNVGVSGSDGFIKWGGVLGGAVVDVLGPIMGPKIHVKVDGVSLANNGVILRGVVDGDVKASTFGCRTNGIHTTSYDVAGYASPNYPVGTIQTNFDRCFVAIPDIANAVGIRIDGNAAGMSTWNCTFVKPYIYMPPTQPAFGVYMGVCDSNIIQGLLVFGTNPTKIDNAPAPVAGQYGVFFDYNINNTFPSSNLFNQPDVGWGIEPFRQWFAVGTPATFAQPNKIENLSGLNRGVYPKLTVPNLVWDLPYRVASQELINRVAGIGAGFVLATIRTEGMYTVTITAVTKVAATTGTIPLELSWDTKDFAGTGTLGITKPIGVLDLTAVGDVVQATYSVLVKKDGQIRANVPVTAHTGTLGFDFAFSVKRET
jgi:hypothetical protein